MTALWLAPTVLLLSAAVNEEADKNMGAYGPPEDGMARYVLKVPKQEDESSCKVELLVGKSVKVDTVNSYFFSGKIERETIEGWGFPSYQIRNLGAMAGTLIGFDPNQPKADQFISLGGEQYLIPYNSRLPIVVYVPEDAEVRYRLWRAETEVKKMEQR